MGVMMNMESHPRQGAEDNPGEAETERQLVEAQIEKAKKAGDGQVVVTVRSGQVVSVGFAPTHTGRSPDGMAYRLRTKLLLQPTPSRWGFLSVVFFVISIGFAVLAVFRGGALLSWAIGIAILVCSVVGVALAVFWIKNPYPSGPTHFFNGFAGEGLKRIQDSEEPLILKIQRLGEEVGKDMAQQWSLGCNCPVALAERLSGSKPATHPATNPVMTGFYTVGFQA